MRWMTLVLVVAASIARGQESLTLDQLQGTWYGWLAGMGVEIKIASVPDGPVAYLKTVQPGATPFLQEVRPSLVGGELVLESLQAPQPFTMRLHMEGKLLFGTYDDSYAPYSIALARTMPDVEQLFEAPPTDAQESPMRAARAEGRRASSARNLQQISGALLMYASQSPQNVYPSLSDDPGKLAPEDQAIYPRFIADPTVFIAPGHPDGEVLRELAQDDPLQVIDDHSYWYLGYLLPDAETATAFLEAYRARAGSGQPMQLEEPITSGGMEIPRLRLGIEQLLVTDPNNPAEAAAVMARIPVMIERPGLQRGGSNVLFLDGHVEFMPFPGPYPLTEAVVTALEALDAVVEQPVATPPQNEPPR